MIAGTIRNPRVGKSYKIYLSTGETTIYIYRGFGNWMSQQWENSATGEVVPTLPSMHGYEEV
jgi:hypothetical protein